MHVLLGGCVVRGAGHSAVASKGFRSERSISLSDGFIIT